MVIDFIPNYPLQFCTLILFGTLTVFKQVSLGSSLTWLLGLACVLYVWRNKEMDIKAEPKDYTWKEEFLQVLTPFYDLNFRWVFFTRLFNACGLSLMQFFIYYWLLDVHSPLTIFGIPISVDFGEGVIVVLSSFSATFTALLGGVLSDKVGRKPLVYVSCIVQAASMAAMAWTPHTNFLLICIFVFCFGLGLGLYTAVDWALIVDVLPSDKNTAKDLGIWQVICKILRFIFTKKLGCSYPPLCNFKSVGLSHVRFHPCCQAKNWKTRPWL